jgi:high-affinity iron transporter
MIISPTIISFREGLEAALVIAIMLTYLYKTDQTSLRRYVLGGTVTAIVSSIVIAAIMGLVWGVFEGPLLGLFEGTVVLLAALLLTTMILWMWNAGAGIASEIESSMDTKTRVMGGAGLALLSFSLVLREGVELVLFSMALMIQDGPIIYAGILLGLAVSTLVGFAIYKGSLTVSLKTLFKWTSLLLILFAAGMVAYGIHELQEAGLLLIGPLEVWNINPPTLPDGSYPLLHENGALGSIAKTLLGYNGNPSALEVVGYFGYLAIVAIYYYARFHRVKNKLVDSIST